MFTCRQFVTIRILRNAFRFHCQASVYLAVPQADNRGGKMTEVDLKHGFRKLLNASRSQLREINRTMTNQPHAAVVKNLSILEAGKILQIEWQDSYQSRFHGVWLRHLCRCEECWDPSASQKLMDSADISADARIASTIIKDANIHLTWNCGHEGVIPLNHLREYTYSGDALERRAEAGRLTKKCTATEIPSLHYEEVIQSESNILKWLLKINRYGICVLKGVPQEEGMVAKVASLVDVPMVSVYGETFDLKSVPDAVNVAYKACKLHFHMDMISYESPPGLQLLHVIKFDHQVTGGESTFLDIIQVARDFRQTHPEHFRSLVEIPATFVRINYSREHTVHNITQKPIINLNLNNEIVCVNWGPVNEGPLLVPENEVEKFFAAHEKFSEAVRSSPYLLTQKLEAGDLVTFNNRRMLHGRREFQMNGGERFLQGCYVSVDHYKSRVQTLLNTVGDGSLVKRVGSTVCL